MMRHAMCGILLVATVMLASPARAVLPENGMYVDPSQSGVGYAVEVQGTTLVMLAFAYDKETGDPLFYLASGTITQAEPGRGSDDVITPPPPPFEHEYPFRFDGTLYRFSLGPCLTCFWPDWDTSEHAIAAGTVHLRMSDVNRILATFSLADGSTRSTTLYRLGFGRPGYDLGRADGRLLPDLRGEWVFVERNNPDAPVRRFTFTEVEPPSSVSSLYDFHGTSTERIMRFIDPVADATMTCAAQGCAVSQDEETLFLVKFWDIGMDNMLGYQGDVLYPSNDQAFSYRTGELVIGKHMIDPTPEAAPPPES